MKLHNNFTTLEQSKKLLEMGVPTWTADCFHTTDLQHNPIEDATPAIITYQLDTHEIVWDKVYGFPCWSVGRLIELYCLATGVEYTKIGISEISLTELMIKLIEVAVKLKTFDFSKLEKFSKLELD